MKPPIAADAASGIEMPNEDSVAAPDSGDVAAIYGKTIVVARITRRQTQKSGHHGHHRAKRVWTPFGLHRGTLPSQKPRQVFEKLRWPGTESNRRRQPFQGCMINNLQTTLTETKGLTR